MVTIEVCTLDGQELGVSARFLVVPAIAQHMPTNPVGEEVLRAANKLKLADPQFAVSGPIQAIIGAGLVAVLADPRPSAVPFVKHTRLENTRLGFIVFGSHIAGREPQCNNLTINGLETLEVALRRLWETEKPIGGKKELNLDERYCEKNVEDTFTCSADGRYVVTIPIHPQGEQRLGRSRQNCVETVSVNRTAVPT